jgi:hypothetical protein
MCKNGEQGSASREGTDLRRRRSAWRRLHPNGPRSEAMQWATTQSNLGVALSSLGKRESGTAKLEEAVVAYREALKEYTRERVPLDWAEGFGNEGVALILLAERRGDAAMAETALSQIDTAFEALRGGGDVPRAAYYEQQLPRARALVARLRGQRGALP